MINYTDDLHIKYFMSLSVTIIEISVGLFTIKINIVTLNNE